MFHCLLNKTSPQFKGIDTEYIFVGQSEFSDQIQMKLKIGMGEYR